MAFVCSIIATSFHIYGSAYEIPHNHRLWYNSLASGFVPVGSQFMIAAFAFGFHLVLGSFNRWLVVFVYTLCLASVLFCFPGVHESPSSLADLLSLVTTSLLFENLRRALFVLLISATFVIAVALSIVLPNY